MGQGTIGEMSSNTAGLGRMKLSRLWCRGLQLGQSGAQLTCLAAWLLVAVASADVLSKAAAGLSRAYAH